MKIVPYDESFREQVIALTLDAWRPVFPKTKSDVPQFVYENFWPQGWEARQATDVGSLIDSNPEALESPFLSLLSRTSK